MLIGTEDTFLTELSGWLARLNDSNILNEFITLKKRKKGLNVINVEEKSEIEEGLSQADKGEVVSWTWCSIYYTLLSTITFGTEIYF